MSRTARGNGTPIQRMDRRQAFARIAPEFRKTPALFLPGMGRRTLKIYRVLGRLRTPSGPGIATRWIVAPGAAPVQVLVVRPTIASTPTPAVLWAHGGGMVMGSPQLELAAMAQVARELGATVVAPDYRLAPDHRFPAALDDCMSSLYWMLDCAESLGIDGARVAVLGGSAGGGLAAGIAQRSHDESIELSAQALLYPMLNHLTPEDPELRGRPWFGLTLESLSFMWRCYLTEGTGPVAPQYASPAQRERLDGLAPAWIGVGEEDPFHNEAVAYGERLGAAGIPTVVEVVPGMFHGADALFPQAPAAQALRASMIAHLRHHLGDVRPT